MVLLGLQDSVVSAAAFGPWRPSINHSVAIQLLRTDSSKGSVHHDLIQPAGSLQEPIEAANYAASLLLDPKSSVLQEGISSEWSVTGSD